MSKNVNDRETYLLSKFPKGKFEEIESKHEENFQKYSRYMGNGVYNWMGIFSPDTRLLFLMGMLHKEGIKFKEI